eukprot:12333-Heterococcus_DN1.PRE.1
MRRTRHKQQQCQCISLFLLEGYSEVGIFEQRFLLKFAFNDTSQTQQQCILSSTLDAVLVALLLCALHFNTRTEVYLLQV